MEWNISHTSTETTDAVPRLLLLTAWQQRAAVSLDSGGGLVMTALYLNLPDLISFVLANYSPSSNRKRKVPRLRSRMTLGWLWHSGKLQSSLCAICFSQGLLSVQPLCQENDDRVFGRSQEKKHLQKWLPRQGCGCNRGCGLRQVLYPGLFTTTPISSWGTAGIMAWSATHF